MNTIFLLVGFFLSFAISKNSLAKEFFEEFDEKDVPIELNEENYSKLFQN